MLEILIRNQGKVLTYSTLARAWNAAGDVDLTDLNANPWRIAISKIRKQLGRGPQRPVIHTEYKVGYRLVVPPSARGAAERDAASA